VAHHHQDARLLDKNNSMMRNVSIIPSRILHTTSLKVHMHEIFIVCF
jgi:hypothetical protein